MSGSAWGKRELLHDYVIECTRFNFTYLLRVDRWSERLAFTHMTQVVSQHLLKCHWARHRLPARPLFWSRLHPLTPLSEEVGLLVGSTWVVVLLILKCKLLLHYCTAYIEPSCCIGIIYMHCKETADNVFFYRVTVPESTKTMQTKHKTECCSKNWTGLEHHDWLVTSLWHEPFDFKILETFS